MSNKIIVTGATGRLGSEIVNQLLVRGHNVKAAVHDMHKTKSMGWNSKKLEIIHFDYTIPSTWQYVFEKMDQLLLIAPPGEINTADMIIPVIDYAKNIGIQKIVFISAIGVDQDDTIPLRIIEQYLETNSIPYSILRCNWFMQNFSTIFRDSILELNCIECPAGSKKISFVDIRDIAAVTVKCFQFSQYTNQILTLTGGITYNFEEIAMILSDRLNRQIKFNPISVNDTRDQLLLWGIPISNISMFLYLFRQIHQNYADLITSDIKTVLKRDPFSFIQYAMDYNLVWKELIHVSSPEIDE